MSAVEILVGVWDLPLRSQEGKMHVWRERECVQDGLVVGAKGRPCARVACIAGSDVAKTRVWLGGREGTPGLCNLRAGRRREEELVEANVLLGCDVRRAGHLEVAIGFAHEQQVWRHFADGGALILSRSPPAHLDNVFGIWRGLGVGFAWAADDGLDKVVESGGVFAASVDVDAVGFELCAGIEVVLCAGGRLLPRHLGGRRERLLQAAQVAASQGEGAVSIR